jgi:hypothetical protein
MLRRGLLLVAPVVAMVARSVPMVVAACERRPDRQNYDGYCQSFHFIPP